MSHSLETSIEALLFVTDTPLSLQRLRQLLPEAAGEALVEAIEALNENYQISGRTFRVREIAGGYQLYTLPDYADIVSRIYKTRQVPYLSVAALESLAIVAYRQPVPRATVEKIRGVACDNVLRHLMERGLIVAGGREETPGRPILYITTPEFLRYFGLQSLQDLPDLGEFQVTAQELFPFGVTDAEKSDDSQTSLL